MEESIFFDNVRSLFALIDRVIYSLIELFYNTLMDLANLQIIDNLKLDEFTTRVYGFIGIIMFFKVSFSLINYIVNPDSISDKERGAGNLIKNILVTFVLIIIVPFGFDLLYDAQAAILEEAVIPKLILGVGKSGQTTDYSNKTIKIVMDEDYCKDSSGKVMSSTVTGIGNFVALATFRPFFQIDEGHNPKYFEQKTAVQNLYCKKAQSVSNLLKHVSLYNAPYKEGTTTEIYVVDYSILVSTIVGIVVALLFLSFCFDTATRTIKLLFLEIIAPVAIISYIDPSSQKNGLFKKWFNEVKNTWLSLFIRLAAVFFAIYIITMFNKNNSINLWLMLFVIIGALMFAKQLPSIIESMLGIKMNGSFSLNPLKKIESEAMFGKQIASLPGKTAAAAAGGALSLAGAIGGHRQAKKAFEKKHNDLSADNARINNILAERQRIDSMRAAELKAARNNADYEAANRRYKQRVANYNKKYDVEDEQQFKNDLINKRNENTEAIMANADKYNEKWSNRHAVAAGIMETLRGTKMGFEKGAKNPKDMINNAVAAAKYSAKEKNNHDIFTMQRRFEDFKTDISGVKNDSGTTSIVKQEIKKTNETLKDLNNYISQLNYSISDFAKKGAISYGKDASGNISMSTIDGYDYQSQLGMSRSDVDRVINELHMLRTEEKTANKRLNELNDAKKLESSK